MWRRPSASLCRTRCTWGRLQRFRGVTAASACLRRAWPAETRCVCRTPQLARGWPASRRTSTTTWLAGCTREALCLTWTPARWSTRGASQRLGGPIWLLGHETWLSDVVRDYLLAQPEDFAPFEGGGSMLDARRGEVYHLPRAIMEDRFFRRCQCDSFGDVRAGLLPETAERWGDEHPLCKVASLLPDKLAVIAKSTAAFADAVWTCKEAVMPDARYVHAKGASVDTLPDAIPEAFCVMEDPVPWRRTLYLDVRAISVAAKHGVSLEQMWQSLSAHMLRRADDKEYASVDKFFRARYKLRDTRRWLAACWRLLALGLHPETRGARGVRGLQLCVRLRSRVGCLLFLAAGADRANVQTVGPCFDAGKECASD
eukprot:Rhum_TRINITY_DN15345_c5_g1::Rhum_TRINITY_DN15345_c5_g1_i8::g.150625::m.150625